MLKQRKLAPIRILALIGWIFIIVSLSGLGLGFKRSSTTYPSVVLGIEATMLCQNCLSPTWQLKAIITLPRKSVLHQSAPLMVSIVSAYSLYSLKKYGDPSLTTPEPDQTQVPTQSVFVQDRLALLGAQLSASAFDVDPQKQLLQRFDNGTEELDFNWTITPKYTGQQTLILTIITPVPTSQQEGQVEQVLTSYVMHLTVDTTTDSVESFFNPFLSLDQVTLGELFVILLGSCLNIPWIMELLQKRKETKEKRRTTQLVISAESTNIPTPDASTSSESSDQLPST
jgi:hypothetical protein